jgi:phospholysine phosphohistidine inorganic pyrophosphate phosphatase
MTSVGGLLLDVDGTLVQDDHLLPGAADTIDAIRRAGLPILFGTNTTRFSRRQLAERLSDMGLHADATELHTAPVAARHWLERQGLTRVAFYVPEATFDDFVGFERTDDRPAAVVVGDLGSSWSFDLLNRAFRQLLDGATLVALQRNRYWRTPDGLTLDAGPMVVALEYAAGVSAVIVGKPSAKFMHSAASALGIECAAMMVVGDDISSDIAGAAVCGAAGVLVKTGKFRAEDLASPSVHPHLVLDSIADLPAALGL